MSYKAILLGILLLLGVPAPSWALTHLIATISGQILCLSSNTPSNFNQTMEIEIIGGTDLRIADDVFDNNSPHADMTSESNISNQKNTGGNFSFGAPGTGVSPVPSQFNGTYKNDSNGDITALTGDIVAKLSNDCTIVGTVKAKLGTF